MENLDLQARINQDKPKRLEKYGLKPEDVHQDLIIDQQQTLRSALNDDKSTLFKVKVTDFPHLKSLIGVPVEVVQSFQQSNHDPALAALATPAAEIQTLSSAVMNADHTHEEAGQLTTMFLTRSNGINDEHLVQLLEKSKVASQVVGAELNVIAYETIELLENQEWVIPNDVNVVTADKLIMHKGSKITVHSLIKFDIHYFQAY